MRKPVFPVLFTTLVLIGCASGGGSEAPGVRRDPNLLTLEDLQSQPSGTAYDAVQRLRPNWLRMRSTAMGGGAGSVNLPRVFVDERDFGTLETLRDFHLDSLLEISYLSAADATTRYGTGYAGGIIHVRLKRNA